MPLRMAHLFALLIAFAGIDQFQPQAQKQSTPRETASFPFQYDPPTFPYIIASVSINNGAPLPFVVDSGCNPPILIRNTVADKIGLPKSGRKIELRQPEMPLLEVPLGPVYAKGLKGERIRLIFKEGYVGNIPLFDNLGPDIAGCLGMPMLASFPVRIDFGARKVTFYPGNTTPVPAGGAHRVKIENRNGIPFLKASIGKGLPIALMVDSGSPGTTLPLEAIKENQVPAE